MIRLLIADDHTIVREGLKQVLRDYSDIQVIGEAKNGNEVLSMCDKNGLDVLLLDISMPGPGFLEILNLLKEKHPHVRILILSMYSEDSYAIRAIKAGAMGYLTKDRSHYDLAYAIRQVYEGNKYVTPELSETLASKLESKIEEQSHAKLSGREYQVLCMIGAGKNSNEIASILSLSPKTISTYRMRVFDKMKFNSNTELIRYVVENKLKE